MIEAARLFQSTRPSRGATAALRALHAKTPISIHAPLAGRDRLENKRQTIGLMISIHAPLAGRDIPFAERYPELKISIHAPLAGRDSKCAQKSRTYLR